jgi:serine/threonine protein kinase
MGAALAEAQTTRAQGSTAESEDREAVAEPEPFGGDQGRRSAPVSLDRFKREIHELGLLRAGELERLAAGAIGDVHDLAKALVRAGKLTPYQAGAISQGKSRGLVVGNYFILEKLGAGGMGVVFKARHRRLGRIVALKILPPSLARHPSLLARFRREVEVAARLSHPNVVRVLDADEDRGVQFMTMEYIEGNDLDRLVRVGGALPVDQALDCVIQAARGLEAAHAQGIVHRDIKPGNLMVDGTGQVRVLDLGLARLVQASHPFGETASRPLTRSGTAMGTVDFMAPEQGIDSHRVDHRADIYSLGCTLCYLLTGQAPFEGATGLAKMMAHQDRRPASLCATRPDVPGTIDAVYQKMMAKEPADRPASMGETVTLLEACRSSPGTGDLARSGLKTFAAPVMINRIPPEVTVRESAVGGAEPPGFELEVDRDDNDPWCPGALADPVVADEVPRLTSPPPLTPPSQGGERKRTARQGSATKTMGTERSRGLGFSSGPVAPSWPSPMASPRSLVIALGGLGVLAMGSLGFWLFSAGAAKPAADRFTIAGSGKASIINPPEKPPAPGPPATAADPRSASTFDVTTVYSIIGPEGHRTGSVETIAVTADGHHALIGSWTEHAQVIDVEAGKRVGPQPGSRDGWQGGRPCVAMTPDGRRALIGTGKVRKDNFGRAKVKRAAGILGFWNLATGKPLFPKRQPYDGFVVSVAISADGLRGLSSSDAGELVLWDLTTGEPRSLGTQPGDARSDAIVTYPMAFVPGGRHAATAVHDTRVHIWDLDTGRELEPLRGHDATISGLAISPDGRRIMTGSFDGTVILWNWDGAQGTIIHRFSMPGDDTGAVVAFDSDGNIVAAGNGRESLSHIKPGNLIVWDANTHTVVRRDEKPFAQHLALAALPGGRLLTGDRFALRLWTPRQAATDATEPPPSANQVSAPVDLVGRINSDTFKIGDWSVSGGELTSPATVGARLQLPCPVPAEYRIDMEVEKITDHAGYGFALGLVVDGRQTEIAFDKHEGRSEKLTGLDGLDGEPLDFSERAHRGELLVPGRPARLSVTVGLRSINLTCDGSIVVNWRGDPKRLVPFARWHIPDRRSLFLASGSSIVFRKLTLTPLPARNE